MSKIMSPMDYTPEKIILDITKLIMDNPRISYFDIVKNVVADEVPTITISLELYEFKKEEY